MALGAPSGAGSGSSTSTPANLFQARLQKDSGTQISLQRYRGASILINGVDTDPGSGGYACTSTDNLIDGTGASAAAPSVPSVGSPVLYYAYVSNENASFAPNDLRLSTTAPSLVSGVKYLGTSGNALNWRYAGAIALYNDGGGGGGAAEFRLSNEDIGICNEYNRLPTPVYLPGGYSNTNSDTTLTITASSYGSSAALVNGGVGDTLTFVGNGEDSPSFSMSGRVDCANGGSAGIGYDSYDPSVTAYLPGTSELFGISFSPKVAPSVAIHSVYMLAVKDGTNLTWYTDSRRYGAAVDNQVGVLVGHVMA